MSNFIDIPNQAGIEAVNQVVYPELFKLGREVLAGIPDKRTNPYTDVPQVATPGTNVNSYIISPGSAPDNFLNGKKSALGTPVMINVVFPAGSFVDSNGVNQSWQEIELQNIICTVSQAKIIVKTQIQGRNGTVKEYIGEDDFVISFDGAINGGYNQYPINRVKQLKIMLDCPLTIPVGSWWLQNLGITDIVISEFNLPQAKGEYSTQYFTFSALSDNPVEARINA